MIGVNIPRTSYIIVIVLLFMIVCMSYMEVPIRPRDLFNDIKEKYNQRIDLVIHHIYNYMLLTLSLLNEPFCLEDA